MANRNPSSPTVMPTILRYGTAVLSVAIANGLAFFVLRHFEAILTPFLFAVAATVWYAGTGPGVLAIVLSVLSLNHFFLRPAFSFSPISYADLVYLIFCIFCALAVGWVSAVRRRAEHELRQARQEFEAKVVERTADLQRSEGYLAETQKLTRTGSWAWDARSQKVLYCSEEMFRIYGLDPQKDLPTRKNFRQRVHPEDRNRTDARFARVVSEKVDSFDEYRVLLPDGTVKHVISSGHPILDGNGELIEFIGTATDVTERKRAEEALRDHEAKIRRLVDSNIIGIFITGLEGRVLEANDAFLHLVGHDRNDLVSGLVRWTDLTPPEWRDRDKRALAELSSNTIAQPYEKEFFRKDGSRVPVLIGGALFEEGGNEGVAFVLDLTDRKCAEQALREREAKIRRLVDSNIIGIFIWHFDGRILEANEAFLDVVGYDHEDLAAGRIRWTDLTPPEWRDRDTRLIQEQKVTGALQPFEKEFFRKDGSRVPVLIGVATFEESGDQGVAFVLDLTERKCAEQALRESEERFRTLVRFSFDVYWESDAQHRFTRQEFAESLADPPAPDSEIGKTRWEVPYLETDAEAWRKHRETLDAHLPFRDFEIARPASDGGKRYISVSGLPVFDKAGRFIGYRGLARRITEQKRAEEALRESERSARSVIDGIAGLVAVMTPNGEVETVNRQCIEYFGRPLEEQKDWVTTNMVHPEDLPHMLEVFKKAIASEIPYHFEQRLRRFDGEYRWFDTRGGAVRDDSGRITRWYVLLTDIEDRVRAMARLEQMQSDFAHMNRLSMMGELVAALSHEISQPIASARIYARAAQNFLDMQPPDLGEVREALAGIVGNAGRAGDIIDRIRDQIKKAPPRKRHFDLNEAINEVIVLGRSVIIKNRVWVQTRLSEGLHPVHGDRVQLQQVVLNLLLNAVEAMASVEEAPRDLLISTRQDHTGVLVAVHDSGPGIHPEHLDRVFSSFYTTKPSGTGMGLSICRSIIDSHGGRLWAEANEPRGTTFQFTLPAV
jgi:PAS domain S-box-containing protein